MKAVTSQRLNCKDTIGTRRPAAEHGQGYERM